MLAKNAVLNHVYRICGTNTRLKVVKKRDDGSALLNPVAEIEAQGRYPISANAELEEPPVGRKRGFVTGSELRIQKMRERLALTEARDNILNTKSRGHHGTRTKKNV